VPAARLSGGGKAAAIAQVMALRALALAVNIGTSLLTAAVLGPGGRGEQAALVLAPSFLGGLASLGLHGSLIYHLKADPARERDLLGTGILLALAAGGLAMLAGWLLEPAWLRQYSAHTVAVGRMLLLATPMIVAGWTLSGAAEARGWFGLVNGALYLQSLATLALLGALALAQHLTPTTAAAAYLLPTVPLFGYVLVRIVRRMRPRFRLRRELARRLLRYGVRLCGVDILGTLAGYTDQLVIVALLPPALVGSYAVALSAARVLNVIQAGAASVLFPSIAARDPAAILPAVAATFRMATLLTAAAAALLLLAGPPLLLLAYGERFAPALLPFRVLLLAVVAENGARLLYQAYAGAGRPELVTGFEAAAVAIALAAMLALVPALATLGAAIAVLAAALFRLAVAILGITRLLHRPVPRLVPGRQDLRLVRHLLARPRPAPGFGEAA
jgi:enterobacterial common antigen flippase